MIAESALSETFSAATIFSHSWITANNLSIWDVCFGLPFPSAEVNKNLNTWWITRSEEAFWFLSLTAALTNQLTGESYSDDTWRPAEFHQLYKWTTSVVDRQHRWSVRHYAGIIVTWQSEARPRDAVGPVAVGDSDNRRLSFRQMWQRTAVVGDFGYSG